jgi:DNA-binding NarL/FixJ family response regulator
MSSQTRVILAESHPVTRAGIRHFLESNHSIAVVSEPSSEEELLQQLATCQCEILILDMLLPLQPVAEFVPRLHKQKPALRTLLLSTYSDEAYILEVLKSGVHGCILKDEVPTMLCQAIQQIAQNNESFFSHTVTSKLLASNGSRSHSFSTDALSRRELQILRYMALGYSNQRIAEDLYLSLGTIKNYVSSIYLKLHVQTRAEAVMWVWKRGMLTSAQVNLV